MSDQMSLQSGLTRRGFLKATGAAVGASALVGGATLSAFAVDESASSAGDQVFQGACRGNCMGGCPLDIYVRDGKVVRVKNSKTPDSRYDRACLKGMSHIQKIYSPDRPLYPMKRVEGTPRGGGQWERISWEEAIDAICTKWKDLRNEYGPLSLGWYKQAGSFGIVSGGHYASWTMKLPAALGALTINTAIDQNYYNAPSAMFGSGICYSYNEPADIANARTLLVWGSNVTDAQLQTWHFFADAIEAGAKLIVIDPMFNTVASKADVYVPVKPGTDAALAFAMCNVLIEEGLMNEAFVKNSTVAPFLVNQESGLYLRLSDLGRAEAESEDDAILVWDATSNQAVPVASCENPALEGSYEVEGIAVRTAFDMLLDRIKEWTPEKAAQECGVAESVIRDIAQMYATNTPSSLFPGFGHDRYYNGYGTMMAIGTFAMLAGSFGQPGANGGICQTSYALLDYATLTDPVDPTGADAVAVLDGGVPHEPLGYEQDGVFSLLMPEAVATGTYRDMPFVTKAIFIDNCNPLNYVANRNEQIKMFENLDFIVCAESRLTDTTAYADIVLPVCHWFEVEDLTHNGSDLGPFLIHQEKAVDPPGECKSDWEIMNLLAEGMGLPGVFGGITVEEAMRRTLDNESAKAFGVTWDRLKEEKIIRWWPDEVIFAKDGVFPTPTGRAQFYLENPTQNVRYGQDFDVELQRLPHYIHPTEVWDGNELRKKYPLSYFQEHTKWRVHSNFSEVPWLRELDPEPAVRMSREDAESRGIATGDIVRMFNDRGQMLIKAIVSDGMQPGTCNVPKGWQACQFIEGHYNDLTSSETNPFNANQQFSDCLVEIEKYEEA